MGDSTTVRLYHATSTADDALRIEEEGFTGSDVWDYRDVVFFADRPLDGFGGWRNAWVAIDLPSTMLEQGQYDESSWDNQQYHARCYCFQASIINRFPRRAFLDRVPECEN